MIAELLRGCPPSERRALIASALLPGVADAALIILLQTAIHAGAASTGSALFLPFCLTLLVQVLSIRWSARLFATTVEGWLYQTRVRIASKIRAAELAGLEAIGAAEIHTRLSGATGAISTHLWAVPTIAQSVLTLVCVALYIAYISPWAFLVILIFYGGGGSIFLARRRRVRQIMMQSSEAQVELFSYLSDLLRGAKELRLNSHRAEDLQADLHGMAERLGQAPRQINRVLQQNFIAVRLCLFLLMASLVFGLPRVLGDAGSASLLAALLSSAIFLFAPLASFLRAVPEYERASLAAAALRTLEGRLDAAARPPSRTRAGSPGPQAGFSRIVLADLAYAYAGPSGFAVGPVSLELRAGEIVFFVGGNGSGKTTLLKTLAGLYAPTAGSLRVDDQTISDGNRQAYRENIAAIFTDFHLFRKLYGLQDRSLGDVTALLEQLRIAHKTSYGDEGFSHIDLSTGQRKRLAMVVALLEDRPLLLFDEWAADQDPEFRRYYYEELLPDLRRRGKTVLCISHDDRYFHCADRVVTLDYGTVREVQTFPPPAPPTASPTDDPSEVAP